MTTDPNTESAIDRIPLTHSVHYVARGLPEVANQYGDGVLVPSEVTLTYRSAPDSQLGRVHAYVAGRLWVNGVEIPLLSGGLYGQHYDDGLDGWPDWLAEEARLHDPEAVLPEPADRAAVLREAADRLWAIANQTTERGAGVLWAADWLRRMADEAQQQPDTEAPFVPPAHYRGRDGTAYCVHATPIGPDSCRECRELANDADQPAAPPA
ncbi:hypothetical protein ACJ6WE_09180 [Streptomyces sp. MMS24-I31]|uniref:hypothetical protein n=1 Tax=Streptomyces sp. MMS24-I31 TaxID=3351563 RepID=UPI003896D8D0